MSKNNSVVEEVPEDEYDDSDEYDDGDYGFIIDSEGELKTVMYPEDLMVEPPAKIQKILKLFGIKNLYQLESKTLH
jgi:hypothetical protein